MADVAHFRQLHKQDSTQGSCISFPTTLQEKAPLQKLTTVPSQFLPPTQHFSQEKIIWHSS